MYIVTNKSQKFLFISISILGRSGVNMCIRMQCNYLNATV